MPTLKAEYLESVGVKIFMGLAASEREAKIVSKHLVNSNLYGVDSHGVIRIVEYVKHIREGRIRLGIEPKVVKEGLCTAMIDGDFGFGQITGVEAMNTAIAKARDTNIGVVGVFNCNHLGRLGEYPMMALEQDMIGGIVAKGPAITAPYGGRSRVLGANPVSFGIPACEERPLLLDFSTSSVAEGKLRVMRARGKRIPEGWILDREGRVSTDPSDFYDGGMLLPFGEYKGYGLSIVIEALAGLLTGAGLLTEIRGINGALMFALNIESFTSISRFKSGVDRLIREIKASPKAAGHNEILVPGELEFREYERRLREGVYIDDITWKEIVQIADELKIDLKELSLL